MDHALMVLAIGGRAITEEATRAAPSLPIALEGAGVTSTIAGRRGRRSRIALGTRRHGGDALGAQLGLLKLTRVLDSEALEVTAVAHLVQAVQDPMGRHQPGLIRLPRPRPIGKGHHVVDGGGEGHHGIDTRPISRLEVDLDDEVLPKGQKGAPGPPNAVCERVVMKTWSSRVEAPPQAAWNKGPAAG